MIKIHKSQKYDIDSDVLIHGTTQYYDSINILVSHYLFELNES